MTIHMDRMLLVFIILWSPFLIGLPLLYVTVLVDILCRRCHKLMKDCVCKPRGM